MTAKTFETSKAFEISKALQISSPVGLIAGGGVMPFAVADSLTARDISPVLFALKGACDPERVKNFRHHWISVGQIGKAENCFAPKVAAILCSSAHWCGRRCRRSGSIGERFGS